MANDQENDSGESINRTNNMTNVPTDKCNGHM